MGGWGAGNGNDSPFALTRPHPRVIRATAMSTSIPELPRKCLHQASHLATLPFPFHHSTSCLLINVALGLAKLPRAQGPRFLHSTQKWPLCSRAPAGSPTLVLGMLTLLQRQKLVALRRSHIYTSKLYPGYNKPNKIISLSCKLTTCTHTQT